MRLTFLLGCLLATGCVKIEHLYEGDTITIIVECKRAETTALPDGNIYIACAKEAK
mgnify:CR=1 FL=1